MGTRAVKSLEAKLIDAATEIVQTHGPAKLSVRAVAAKADCSIGTLYNYFRDMNELILKINARTLLQLQKAIAKAVAQTTAREQLGRTLAREYIGFAKRHTPFWNLLFRYKLPEGQTMPPWYRDIIEDNFRLLESALTPHLDPQHVHLASRTLWGAFHGIISLAIDGKLDIASPEAPERLCESLFVNYLKGIG